MEGRLVNLLTSRPAYSIGRFYKIVVHASGFDTAFDGTLVVFDELTGRSDEVHVHLTTGNETLGMAFWSSDK